MQEILTFCLNPHCYYLLYVTTLLPLIKSCYFTARAALQRLRSNFPSMFRLSKVSIRPPTSFELRHTDTTNHATATDSNGAREKQGSSSGGAQKVTNSRVASATSLNNGERFSYRGARGAQRPYSIPEGLGRR